LAIINSGIAHAHPTSATVGLGILQKFESLGEDGTEMGVC